MTFNQWVKVMELLERRAISSQYQTLLIRNLCSQIPILTLFSDEDIYTSSVFLPSFFHRDKHLPHSVKTFPTSSCLCLPLSFKCSWEIYYTKKSLCTSPVFESGPHKGSDTDKFFEWLIWLMDRLINMLTALLNLIKIDNTQASVMGGFP